MISTQSVPLIVTYHKSSNSLNENQDKELQMNGVAASIATQESSFPVVYSESINIDELKIDVDNSSPMKMMNRPEIPEDENGTVPVDVFISEDDEYYIVGAEKEVLDAMVQQSERKGKYPILPDDETAAQVLIENTNITLNKDLSIKSAAVGMSESVPSVWTRGDTIAVRVTIINMGTSSAYLTVTFEGWDVVPSTGYWYKEFSASKYVVVRRQSYKTIWLYPQVPYTSVGLKKAIVKATGSAYIVHDLGYNFVQKYNENELNLDDIEPLQYISDTRYYYELSDRFHYTNWNIRKEAGNAGDSTNTPYSTGQEIYTYTIFKMHGVKNSDTYPWADSDEWIINNGYIGVCDEYATFFATLMKALGLPARLVYFDISNLNEGHAIAEFWDGSRWVHSDPAMRQFDNPSYYRVFLYWFITHVWIVYGANDSQCSWEGPSGDGILHPNPWYWDGVHDSQNYGDTHDWVTYASNPYQ